MNQHTLRITAQDQPTVLERLLQVTRYRGFAVTGMTMFQNDKSQMLDIQLSVQSDKPIDNLCHQLNKLFDVSDVALNDKAVQQCSA